ncbi:MAG TPA: BamA/TamA family outer membrane protein [Longimicrobiales bacterium]|nr:BamA/TamA family outer membrane protein [Longimicrobiales bacterium]
MAGEAPGRWTLRGALLLGALAVPASGAAQESLFLVNDSTIVESVDFEITGPSPFSDNRLGRQMEVRGPGGLDGLRNAFAWLPLLDPAEPPLFDPVSLQMDVARLRQFLIASGFPAPEVDYRIRFDPVENGVSITMTVTTGPPRILDAIRLQVPAEPEDQLGAAELEAGLREEWLGRRVGADELQAIQERAVAWGRERGYAFATGNVALDTPEETRATVEVTLEPGPMTTIGGLQIEPGHDLDSLTILRHLLVEPGDTIRARRLDAGAAQLERLELVDAAFVQLAPGQAPNPTPQVRVRVLERSLRSVSGRTGYADDRGVVAEARFEHRNLFGGGRFLQASTQAETGLWSFEDYPEELYGTTVSLTQPYVWSPRLDLVPSVFWYYEDGPKEESRRYGGELSLILARGPNRFVSLAYRAEIKDVLAYRGLDLGARGVFEALETLEGLVGSQLQTNLTLSAAWGERDDLAAATNGWSVSSSLSVAGPDPWSDVQYLRGTLAAAWLKELRTDGPRILARGRVGHMIPFGRSREGGDEGPLSQWVRLGTSVFTEGGTESVRGFKSDQLGPKLPDFRVDIETETIVPNGRWVPLGGLSRWGASTEIQVPLFGSPHYALAFVDGARVWTGDGYYLAENGGLPLDITDGTFFTTGAGLALGTPIGAIRLMVGFKLNPSEIDLRDPNAVLNAALQGGTELQDIPENPWRRFRIHLAIGQPF